MNTSKFTKHVSLAGMARDTADCRNRFSAKWSARREGELIRMLAHEGTEQMRILWLRSRQHHTSHLQQAGGQPCQGRAAADPQAQQHAGRQPRDGQPSQRRAAAHPQAQQKASRQPKPAAARAQDVPKPATEAQAKRRERSWEQLKQKHLARALARERIARRLRAWCARARVALVSSQQQQQLAPRFDFSTGSLAAIWPLALAAPPPATQLAAPASPSQQPSLALAAAARASLDASEMQDVRGSKRDALARTPPRPAAPPTRPPPAEPRKKTRGVAAFEAALAAASPAAAVPQPPTDAATSHTFALSTANPYQPLA